MRLRRVVVHSGYVAGLHRIGPGCSRQRVSFPRASIWCAAPRRVRVSLAIALLAGLALAAAGQPPPKTPCIFDGFDTNAKLAETLKTGDPVVVSRVEGDWTCGYLTSRKGAAQTWVRSKDIRPLTFDPNPPLTPWLGTWVQDENQIQIQS